MNTLRYNNYIFDFDSTLVTIEGIDELGELKGMRQQIEELTHLAMSGRLELEEVFQYRLQLLKPSLQDTHSLADQYLQAITPGAVELLQWIRHNGGKVFVVTGGYRNCLLPTTDVLGIPRDQVFANRLFFSSEGTYQSLDASIPLWKNNGKAHVVDTIRHKYPGKIICIGDGISDYEAGLVADNFIYYGGVVLRPEMMKLSQSIFLERDLAGMKVLL